MKQRYTLILHGSVYSGSYGNWQVISFKRVQCRPCELRGYYKRLDVHFVVKGWPEIKFQSGIPYFEGNSSRENRSEVAA